MHTTLAWEGLRDRWSSRDSAGVGITDLAPIALPVVVVGHDEPDDHHENIGYQRGLSGGGQFPAVGLEASESHGGLFVLGLTVFDTAGVGGAFPSIQLIPQEDFVGGTIGFFLRQPQAMRMRHTVGGTPTAIGGATFAGGALRFERPGCFVPSGNVLAVGYAVANAALAVSFHFREA